MKKCFTGLAQIYNLYFTFILNNSGLAFVHFCYSAFYRQQDYFIIMKNKKFFSETLLKWNEFENTREMPWKGEKDPYKIWISEIILQQTRVQQGLAYFNRFIHAWPDIKSLAGAPEQEVYKLWEGLGYYNRCSNLIASAKFINDELAGRFPDKYEDILSLKGIGHYTASAIASFAFGLPHAVVDGNVLRVLARFFGIQIPTDTTEGKKMFRALAADLIDTTNPAAYNQAIMDFGAVVCKPVLPLCNICPLQKKCMAWSKKMVPVLPVKEKSTRKRERFFNYLIVEQRDKVYVNQRTNKDIWQNLYEFILIETKSIIPGKEFLKAAVFTSLFPRNNYSVAKISKISRQKLTHQTITGRFFHITLKTAQTSLQKYKPVTRKELSLLPFPKFITSYLKD
jgi:A/G-specific adenine glycosylase